MQVFFRSLAIYSLAIVFILTSFLARSQELEVSVQRGHSAAVLCVAVHPDGQLMASAGKDKTIVIWEVGSGRQLRTMTGHEYSIYELAFDHSGKRLFSADAGGEIKIWNYTTGEQLDSWKGHKGAISSLKLSGSDKLLITGGRDDQVKVWNWKEKKVLHQFKFDGGQYGVRVDIDQKEELIIAAGDNAKIYLTDLTKNLVKDTLRETSYSFCGGCYARAVVSPDQSWIAGVSQNGPLVLWEKVNVDSKIVLEEKVSDINNLEWDASGKLILVSLKDKTVVYELESKKKLGEIPKKKEVINAAVFSPDGKTIFQVTNANVVLQFSINGDSIATYRGKLADPIVGDLNLDPNSYWDSFAYRIATLKSQYKVSHNGKWAIKGRTGNQAIIWDIENGKPYRILTGHKKAITAFEFSPDDKMLLTGDTDGNMFVWDILSGDTLTTKRFHFNMVLELSFSNDGKTLATGAYDGYLNFIDVSDYSLQKRINFSRTQEYFDSPYSITFSPNDNYVAVGSLGKKLSMIEVDSGDEFKQLVGHTDVVSSAVFYNNMLFTISWDGKIKAWDYRTGFQEWKIESSVLQEQAMLFIEEKNLLLSAGNDRTIKVFDLRTNSKSKELEGHSSTVNSLSYLPEKDVLISSTITGEVIYWNLSQSDQSITQYFTGPKEYVILDNQGNFNATQLARDAVIFVDGVKSYRPEQFFDRYFRPDLQPLSYLEENKDTENNHLAEVIKKFPPADVEIMYPKNGEELNQQRVNVMIKTTNKGGGVEEVILMHNGKSIVTKVEADSKIQQRGRSLTETYELELLPGQNIVEVLAKNNARIESERDRVVVNYTGKEPIKKCIIFCVGINKYKNPKLNLNFASADAQSIASLLQKSQGVLFDKIELIELYDKDATKENILNALDRVKQLAKPSDVFYFYYAGHGSMNDNTFYFIPTDNVRLYDPTALNEEAISDHVLQEKFKEIAALKQVVIIDACQSGGGVQTLALRGANNEKALAQLSRSAGVHVMASAGSEQFAAEFEELGHGLFTFTLIEALNGAADGAPKDGAVSVYELKSYLDAKVPVYSEMYKGQAQYPHTFSMGQDFPIFFRSEK